MHNKQLLYILNRHNKEWFYIYYSGGPMGYNNSGLLAEAINRLNLVTKGSCGYDRKKNNLDSYMRRSQY